MRVVGAAAVEAAKAEVAVVVVRVEAAIVAAAVVRAAAAGRVETARATRAVVGIASAPVITVPGPMAAVQRVGLVTVVEIATKIATGTEIVIGIGTEIEIVTGIGIGIVMINLASIVKHAFTSPRIMAVMDIAPTPTTGVTRTACTRAQTMRAAGKVLTRSVHTFTGMVLTASPLLSATEVATNRLIEMASYVAMKKDSNTMNSISVEGAFTDSDSYQESGTEGYSNKAEASEFCEEDKGTLRLIHHHRLPLAPLAFAASNQVLL